jgi:hypothetical protein
LMDMAPMLASFNSASQPMQGFFTI